MKLKHILAASLTGSILLVGCGSSSDSTTSSEETLYTGQFIDAPVSTLQYKTDSSDGFTDLNGSLPYKKGETCTFQLGDLVLGTLPCAPIMSVYTLVGDTNISAPSQKTKNIARILQSLDMNASNSDLITLDESMKDFEKPADLNISNNIDAAMSNILIAADEAYGTVSTFSDIGESVAVAAMQNYINTNFTDMFTQPSVDTGSVTEGETDVVSNANLTLTFNKKLDSSTINASTVLLKDDENNTISGTISYDEVSKVITFNPTSTLDDGTQYVLTLTTGIKDIFGKPLSAQYSTSFTTGTADITAPTLDSSTPSSPVNNANDVSLNSAISVTFGENLDASTITSETVTLKDASNTNVTGTVTYANKVITFTPSADLNETTQYTLTITTGVKDVAGNGLSSNVILSFTTGTGATASIGELNTDFGTNGEVSNLNGEDYKPGVAIAVDENEKIYVTTLLENFDMYLYAYTSDGILDTSFDNDGVVSQHDTAGGNQNTTGQDIIIDTDGKILVAGYSMASVGGNDMVVWRYNTDGTLDTTFGGGNGFVTDNNASGGDSTDRGSSIAIDSTDKIYVGGISRTLDSTYDLALWKYNTDGTLDTTFGGGNGIVTYHDSTSSLENTTIQIDENDNIFLAGATPGMSDNNITILKYDENGTLDSSFGGGDGTIIPSEIKAYSFAIAIANDGKLYLSGGSSLARYLADGSLDTSFGTDGIATITGGVSSILLDNRGNIILSGTAGTYPNLKAQWVMLDENGVIVSDFGTNGYLQVDNGQIYTSTFNSDKSVIYSTGQRRDNNKMTVWSIK